MADKQTFRLEVTQSEAECLQSLVDQELDQTGLPADIVFLQTLLEKIEVVVREAQDQMLGAS
jgi:hypothetical protein